MQQVTNPYLAGNFAPVPTETTAYDLAVVSGHLPPELNGRYLRIGPNPVDADPETYHWFTGTGMVHGVRLAEGRAEWYRNRFVRGGSINQQMGWSELSGPTGVVLTAVNTTVIGHAGRTYALVEAGGNPIELSDELESVARADFSAPDRPGIDGPFSAHPKRDPVTDELHVVAYYWGWDYVQYQVIGADGVLAHATDIPVGGSPMMHDLSITESSVIFYDLPVTFNLDAAIAGAALPYQWEAERTARIGVLPKGAAADQIRWYEVEPCFVFHPMNAYDTPDGGIVLDVIRHDSMFRTDLLGPNEGTPYLHRWTVDPVRGTVTEERRADYGSELPRVDERLVGRRARYGYGTTYDARPGEVNFGPLVRHDLDTGDIALHDYGPTTSSMEAVFIPRHPDAAEDDGWVLSMTYDAAADASQLVVLDADDFTGPPVAVVQLPQRVPFGFHGNWIPDPD